MILCLNFFICKMESLTACSGPLVVINITEIRIKNAMKQYTAQMWSTALIISSAIFYFQFPLTEVHSSNIPREILMHLSTLPALDD